MFTHLRTAAVVVALAVLLAVPACKKDGDSGSSGMGLTDARLRMISSNNLKQIGIALHAFHDVNGYLPHHIAGPDGKTQGLSWRVAILPYIEQQALYNQFRLNEPWDSEHNRQLIWQIPKQYVPPGVEGHYNGYTYYRMFGGPKAILPPVSETGRMGVPGGSFRGLSMSSITDGTSNTLAVAEAAEPVLWTKPDELEFDPKGTPPALGGIFQKGTNVLLLDGSVRFFPKDLPPETLKAAITVNGGERVDLP